MRLALCQINTTVGDFPGNLRKIQNALKTAESTGCRLVVFPELSVCGYPPRDLVERRGFVRRCMETLQEIAQDVPKNTLALVGTLEPHSQGGRPVYNAAAAVCGGRILRFFRKALLPNYDVFDEHRNFQPYPYPQEPLVWENLKIGVTICEDIWNTPGFLPEGFYDYDPLAFLSLQGCDFLVNLSSSPYHAAKPKKRLQLLKTVAGRMRCPVVYTNLVGGNDELIFDGSSMVVDAQGRLRALGKAFEEDVLVVDLDEEKTCPESFLDDEEEIHRALTLGLRDYAQKSGFERLLLGLSGGIDSALTAVLAAKALGAERVLGITLPSPFSSRGSIEDSRTLAQNLGISFLEIPITPYYEKILEGLKPFFEDRPVDVTEENLQARLRGLLLMAFSNKFRSLLLATGNKSELAMGYCTLYGDMSGGLSVIGDLPKTWVYRLARWINREKEIIPQAVLTKPPSAELKPNQKDQDTLPPYDRLDKMLQIAVEEGGGVEELCAAGFTEEEAWDFLRRLDTAEYKRRQAAPVLKVTAKAFGTGRRYPIVQKYTSSGGYRHA